MSARPSRRGARFRPALRKKRVVRLLGYDLCTVDAFAVRNLARPDEEFDNFTTRDEFPDLVGEREIWFSDLSFEREGLFFVADALLRRAALAHGASEDEAMQTGLDLQRQLRRRVAGPEIDEALARARRSKGRPRPPDQLYVEPYLTLPDEQGPIEVWLVDGRWVRDLYKTDYTEGGHGYVYSWVPRDQIWVEKDIAPAELPFMVVHEYIEVRLMRDEGLDYDHAHEVAARVEFEARKVTGIVPLLTHGHRRLTKRHLAGLTEPAVLAWVRDHHLSARGRKRRRAKAG